MPVQLRITSVLGDTVEDTLQSFSGNQVRTCCRTQNFMKDGSMLNRKATAFQNLCC